MSTIRSSADKGEKGATSKQSLRMGITQAQPVVYENAY